ncbi:PBS lyase HEAT domain protein repeat-containing protein [Arthrobacter sp. Hiyo4]|nr:PBS lyase HEAT domain protein repeat-containing protein [Arthrobacter sp. Hiyo4]
MGLYDILFTVLLTESGILGAGLSLMFGHAAFRQLRAARLHAAVAVSRDILARVLAGARDVPALPKLPLDKTVESMAEAARSIDSDGRARLAELPAYGLLLQRATRWCRSRSWSRRLKAVRMLIILGAGEDLVPRLLEDPRPEVRAAAAAWTASHPGTDVVLRLVQMLSDDALSCRLTAQSTLIRLGRHSVPAIIADLAGSDPQAPATTLNVGARLNDPELLGPALAYRCHADPEVRAAVARVIASSGGAGAVRTLESFLADPAPEVRARAATGLAGLGHWPSVPLLAAKLVDPAWEVRRAAGIALDRLGGPGRLYLQRALTSTDQFARDMARQVLDLPGPAR